MKEDANVDQNVAGPDSIALMAASKRDEHVELDEILIHIGEYKKAQIILTILLSLLIISPTYTILSILFVTLDSPWKCSTYGNGNKEYIYNGTFDSSHALYNERCTMNRTAWEFSFPKGYSIVTEVRF